jgi:hypothetical protein
LSDLYFTAPIDAKINAVDYNITAQVDLANEPDSDINYWQYLQDQRKSYLFRLASKQKLVKYVPSENSNTDTLSSISHELAHISKMYKFGRDESFISADFSVARKNSESDGDIEEKILIVPLASNDDGIVPQPAKLLSASSYHNHKRVLSRFNASLWLDRADSIDSTVDEHFLAYSAYGDSDNRLSKMNHALNLVFEAKEHQVFDVLEEGIV